MLRVTSDDAADQLLRDNPLALLLGMLLDQQVPMEWAFGSPLRLQERIGQPLDAATIASIDPDKLVELFADKPSLHRYPRSMAQRAHALCQHVVDTYDGEPARIWTEAGDGAELFRRVKALPGYGDEKAKIFIALLGKQFSVTPDGWEQAAGAFSDDQHRSVADIDGPEALEKVREYKKILKAKGKGKDG